MKKESFYEVVKVNKKKQPWVKNSIIAFLSGGVIGLFNQGFIDFNINILKLSIHEASALSSIVIVFITSILTLLGFYKHLGKLCGAGLFIPTTGFANSITSSAIEGRDEGYVLGIGGQIFSLAGSVITYAIVASIVFLLIKFAINFVGAMIW